MLKRLSLLMTAGFVLTSSVYYTDQSRGIFDESSGSAQPASPARASDHAVYTDQARGLFSGAQEFERQARPGAAATEAQPASARGLPRYADPAWALFAR